MVYINNIYTGLLVFPFIAAVFTMPYAIYQYNRHGSVSKLRTLIIYSFILYMLIAFFMVSLPLPDRESTVGNRWQDHLNLIPCRQIWLYWRNKAFNLKNIRAYMKSMSLWFFTEFPLLLADKLTDGPIEILHNDYLFLALALVSRLYFVAYLIIVISQKNARMPHEKISGTFYMAAVILEEGK